jgi:hypothetical protein
MVEPIAEPSRNPVDVTRVPLDAIRSSGLATAELVTGQAAVQAQNMDQYDDEFTEDD